MEKTLKNPFLEDLMLVSKVLGDKSLFIVLEVINQHQPIKISTLTNICGMQGDDKSIIDDSLETLTLDKLIRIDGKAKTISLTELGERFIRLMSYSIQVSNEDVKV